MVKIVTFLSGHYNTQLGYGWPCHFGSISDDLTDLLWWYWGACNSRIHCWIWTEIGQFYGTIDGNESGSISCLSSLCKVRGFTSLRTDSPVHGFFSSILDCVCVCARASHTEWNLNENILHLFLLHGEPVFYGGCVLTWMGDDGYS